MSRLLTPLLLLMISIALFVWFTQPLMDDVATINSQITSLQSVLSSASELASVRDSLLKNYNQISDEDKTRLAKALPDQVDNVRLIIDVDTIASKYGMKLKNAQVTADAAAGAAGVASADGKRYSTVTLGFSVNGSYDKLKLFLADLEKSLRIVDINSLSFSADDHDNNEYSIILKTYWFRS